MSKVFPSRNNNNNNNTLLATHTDTSNLDHWNTIIIDVEA